MTLDLGTWTDQNRRELPTVPQNSILTCTDLDAPDAYCHAIWRATTTAQQYRLVHEEGIYIPGSSNLTINIFRRNVGAPPWSMSFSLKPTAKPAFLGVVPVA